MRVRVQLPGARTVGCGLDRNHTLQSIHTGSVVDARLDAMHPFHMTKKGVVISTPTRHEPSSDISKLLTITLTIFPRKPTSPSVPFMPMSPFSPLGPGAPSIPEIPLGPGSPTRPGSPDIPARENNNTVASRAERTSNTRRIRTRLFNVVLSQVTQVIHWVSNNRERKNTQY